MNDLSNPQLLVLSNGHGEDVIAVRILQELQQLANPPQIFALPLVGEGSAYQKLGIPLIGSVRTMPSGGFIYMDGKQLVRDMQGGLVQLTLNQIQAVRNWVNSCQESGQKSGILAVGDIVPLLFASLSGANYAFVGTAKSEYYVRDEVGLLKRKTRGARWENFSGSIYHPWERWLMSRPRCQAVFPRDSLTTKILQKWQIPAFDMGNPMMDGLQPSFPTQNFYRRDAQKQELPRPLLVTILPGSRPPEAYNNWERIIIAVSTLITSLRNQDISRDVIFLGAIAPSLHFDSLSQILQAMGWVLQPQAENPLQIADSKTLVFKQNHAYFILTQNAYNDCLHLGDLAIATAGTATEQFVGLGKPAIIIPGSGPQFTPAFAEAQTRLLGKSVILVEEPQAVAAVALSLLNNPDQLHQIAENGVRRMGVPGAARKIAECLRERLY
ncbi:MAG: lipid-A-disaccharide synthase-related protein [Nostocaceae cyanobacterium]|nr:lipid-A-disaccharide synthase-related protein [Nostocaceae cyanobacterium]